MVLTGWAGAASRAAGIDVRIGQPVDRLVRQRAVDPGLQIKGQQLLDGRCAVRRHGGVCDIRPI